MRSFLRRQCWGRILKGEELLGGGGRRAGERDKWARRRQWAGLSMK